MTPWTAAALDDHLAGFLAGTLPRARWAPHGHHLAVTVVRCRALGLPAAVDDMRAGIQRINRAIGVPPEAYHETVTRFYVSVVHALLARLDDGRPDAALVNALVPRLDGPREARLRLWAHYYAHPEATLAEPAARRGWVEPDLRPVDDLPGWLLVPLGEGNVDTR